MVQSQPDWLGQTIGGRYHIDAWLDQGGMSTVYKATDPNLKRPVAIKVIHPHLSRDPEFVRRFEQEASAVAQLRHPNIVQVYDFDHDRDVYYMVLEFVPGETLKSRLASLNKAGQRLSLATAIHIMVPVARAVAYAHRQGMVHRDLKPANVMLSPQGQPILMDFGVAKMLGETQHTMTGAIIGTALYMSPEQARGERADERADIYSMGVMLFEMVTGQPPFEADSAISILMKHATQPVPDIRELNRDIPDALVGVIEKALAKHPSDRFQTAEQFAEALQAVEVATDVSPVDHTTLRAGRPATSSQVMPSQVVPPAPAQPAPAAAAAPTGRGKALWLFGAVAVVLVVALGLVALFVTPGLLRPAAVPQEAAADTGEEPVEVAVEPEPALSEEAEPAPTPEPVAVVEVSEEEALLPLSEGMVRIEAGAYNIGLAEADSNHVSPQTVDLAEFWLDEREVTNADYFHFLGDSNFQPPSAWENGNIPAGEEQLPVKGVTWEMADAYCTWARKRLPTEAEWEVAARGKDGRLFPWGDDERAVQLPRIGTYEVGSITPNLSPFGAYDMAGNVWEWVGEPYVPIEDGQRVLRGGGGGFLQDMAYRLVGDPNVPSMVATAGIRCAASQVKEVEHDHSTHSHDGVLSFDDFTDPGSGWPSIAEGNYVFDYHPPEDYHLEVAAPGDHLAVTREQQYQDVTIETMAHLAKSDTETGDYRYGLVARRTGDDYYAFTVSPRTKRWYVLKRSAEGLEVLAEGEDGSIQGKEEARDRLRVDVVGPNLVFHINDRVVAQVSDTSYASGEVGFYDETFDETMAHIHFDSLTIRQPELPEATANVLSFDDFTDPGSGWPSIAEGNYVFDYHPPEDYHLEVAAPGDHLAVTREQQYQDVTIETMAHLAKSDTETGDYRYGLVARRTGDDYYAFTVSPRTKRWYVLKRSAEGLEVLAEGEDGSIQGKEEARDRLRVDMVGPNLVFHINDRVVAQVSDTSYASGEVGFYDETFDETMAHIHFDSLTIRQPELPEATANVLSFDDFTDPGSGWPSIAEGNYVFDYHPPEDYHLEVAAPGDHLAVTREQQYQDVTIETMAHLAKSDTETGDYRYGLVARRTGDDYYAFTVSPRTKRWYVLKRSAEGLEVLAEGEDGSIQGKEEARDRLRVDMVGPNLVFHINDRVVAQVSDTSYASGEVGFYDETFDETMAHIHFDSLTIRQAEDLVIAAAPEATPVPPTAEAIPVTATPAPTATPAIAPTATPAPPPPAAPPPAPVPPGMVRIPAGHFMMGSASGPGDEQPEHPVLLDTFLLDLFEVTNRQYRQCVNDGGCTQTGFPDGFTRPGYRDDPAFDNYPVVGVTWDQATAYCRWAGKRLPTEAEWEYAAGGPDNLTWPWGNTFDPGLSAASAPDTQPVGSFPAGASPFGVFDMAGNVAEWVVDAYSEGFYASSPASNPVNSSGGAERVFRGGSFANPDQAFYTASRRYHNSPAVTDVDVGFRCAQNSPVQPDPAQREALVAEFCQVFAGVKPGAACP